jgi:hypothetical protein
VAPSPAKVKGIRDHQYRAGCQFWPMVGPSLVLGNRQANVVTSIFHWAVRPTVTGTETGWLDGVRRVHRPGLASTP